MIIFDLDGTLADCEHRRHLIDPAKYPNICEYSNYYINARGDPIIDLDGKASWRYKRNGKPFEHGWNAFYKACYDDECIYPTWSCFNTLRQWHTINIWSGRCESVRDKTIKWLMNKTPLTCSYWSEKTWNHILKMRPIGDNTPDDVLKEKWLDEYLSMPVMDEVDGDINNINFVFDDRPKVVRMWRRRGIFVFNCCQHDNEF